MAATVMGGFLDRVRAAVGPADDPRSDAQLLAAFGDRRDADAFAVLVHRYGPLVWTVCRRLTPDAHAAEDAFQATFLVLARKAGVVRPRHSAGGWLHRTATHVALKARAMTDRRTRRERPNGAGPEPAASAPPEPADAAALAALDEEIARLPDGLRAAVVLCELQGVPRRAAAARLGVPEGTVSSRLSAARKRLADRLRQRGVVPIGGVAALLALGSAAEAAVPSGLVAAASVLGTGDSSPVPAAVSALAGEEIRTMLLTKLTSAAGLTVGLIALAFGFSPTPPTAAADPPVVRAARLRAPAPPRESVLVLTAFQPGPWIELLKPSGEAVGRAVEVGAAASPINPGGEPVCPLWKPRLSPDGKRLAAVKLGPIYGRSGPWTQNHLWVFDLDSPTGPTEPLLSDLRCPSAVWSRDGTKLYVSCIDPEKIMEPVPETDPHPLVCWVIDPKTKVRTTLALPPGHEVADLSPDGKTLLTVLKAGKSQAFPEETYLVPLETLKPRRLTGKPYFGARFSPDGTRVVGTRVEERKGEPIKRRVSIVSVADGTETLVRAAAEVDTAYHPCWSPDGKRLAYIWTQVVGRPPAAIPPADGPYGITAFRLTVCDADGGNAKVIVRRKESQSLMGLDWR